MIKLLLADIKKRDHAGYYDHNSIERSSITGTERVKITGVSFDELTLADWEANKLGEESYHLRLLMQNQLT